MSPADIAEFHVASADHVVASLDPLNKYVASWTPFPLLEVLLKVAIAGTLVLGQLAFSAKPDPALIAVENAIRGVHDSFAVLGGTQPEVGVADGLLPETISIIPIFRLLGKAIEY